MTGIGNVTTEDVLLVETMRDHLGEDVFDNDALPYGAVIATAELVECYCIGCDALGAFISVKSILTGNWVKYKYIEDKNELLFGDWTPGRYAWEFANTKLLPVPIPVRGKQGLWNWEVPEGVLCEYA